MSNSGGGHSNLGSSSSSISQQDIGDKSQNPQGPQPGDWDDPIAFQLEELLFSNIRTIFQNAIKQLCESGYSEDIAQKAISRMGLYQGGTDLVANIVNDAVTLLKRGKDIDNSKNIVFENLQEMVEYTMLELVNVLREVKSSLSTGEAMWWLLVCDMNISQACAVEGDLLNEFGGKKFPGESSSDSSLPKSGLEAQCSRPIPSNTKKENFLSTPASFETSSVQPKSQTSAFEGKSKKGRKSLNKKELAAGKKTINSERVLMNHGKSGSQSGNVTSFGSSNVEKRMKSPFESHGVKTKNSASNTKAKVQAPMTDGSSQVPSNSPSVVSASGDSSKVHMMGTISASAATNTELTVSGKKPPLQPETSNFEYPKIADYYARIPYDESLGKYVPQYEKDELILRLVPEVQELQKELQSWTDWANQKVMQAARRLSQDKPELEALKLEKQEAEQFKKEKKMLEENAMKRLSEMELALINATGQIEMANSTIRKLEVENSLLKDELDIAKLQAVESAVNCEAALEREHKALKNAQSWKGQKSLLLEELETHKQKVVKLQQDIGKAEKIKNQIEARWEQQRLLKEKLLAEAVSIKDEREQLEAAAKAEEDMVRQKAENDLKKYMEDISKLEKQISELNLKTDASKIAALRWSIDGNKCQGDDLTIKGSQDSNIFNKEVKIQGTFGSGGLKRDRECVMCLSEEKSVVFLPCAHQVLCKECNELHKKEGMKDCPSCRSPIQQRIPARFAHP
ncbi:putative E3 ubiquitin-protein ligase RF298 [Hevea brasiliensis]|uniref:putative E3 ubiquitin-protein ligase RF298 n=1 Tax=Hevea brasiliensis TaxID=3981 RepID=UPI0025DE2FB0|nr:putative E3 ubiquitin-protein ligase RF298 [Hevea brasiliensis]XP_021681376.2 putative E3 ubiquitin-protein ligase RF298 [Hevea brasiliensis]